MGAGSYKVVADYRAAYPDPIVMKAGERLRVGVRDEDNDAWVWCTESSGKSGWVPVAYVRLDGEAGTALRDYSAVELSVRTGETLDVLEEEAGWVLAGDSRGRSGWVPLENVERS
ncbi:MAG TPA: SH3 domain-containing protein [Rubrobacter sp.]